MNSLGAKSKDILARPALSSNASNQAFSDGGEAPPATNDFLLLENGDYLLLENGDKLILE